MKEKTKKTILPLCLCGIFVALATALSFIKIYKLPLGGSVTLFSMLPIIMLSFMLGKKWGLSAAFCYSVLQLFCGIAFDGLLGWGLTPTALIGTIFLDYIIPFTILGLASVFGKKNILRIALGTAFCIAIRFLSHFLSGFIIFRTLEQFAAFGNVFSNRPILYSLCYNGSYMLPELIITVIGACLLFSLPQIKKMINK